MKRALLATMMLAAPCYSQSTTDCSAIGDKVHCQTQSSQQGPDFRLLSPVPDYAGSAIHSYQQGVQQGTILRQQREINALKAAQTAREPQSIQPDNYAGYPAADKLPIKKPTARQVYVACNLMLEGTDVPRDADGRLRPISSQMCQMLTRYYRSPKATDPKALQACPPDSLIDPDREMAIAFIEFYNENGVIAAPFKDGPTAFDIALVKRWPCA